MYTKAYGVIETLAPLHVGASAGEETGNLNLIFRDQFLQTGIIPGSSIRGRLRSDLYRSESEEKAARWYGHRAQNGLTDSTTESTVKFEYASIIWLPVFCPGQPIVWVSCPSLLERYRRIVGLKLDVPEPYTGSDNLGVRQTGNRRTLFFNLGFLTIKSLQTLDAWFPDGKKRQAVVVSDGDMAMIHDMALYRQTRVALAQDEKKVSGGAFFNVEALPEGTLLVFPLALKSGVELAEWQPINGGTDGEVYLGGLESVGFGHCHITIKEVV
jgi:CRISPR-associated protein Cmr4